MRAVFGDDYPAIDNRVAAQFGHGKRWIRFTGINGYLLPPAAERF
jgi:hypothetical protein